MSQLQQRRDKVQRLTNQALKDKIPHKYMQGVYILNQIAMHGAYLETSCIETNNPILVKSANKYMKNKTNQL